MPGQTFAYLRVSKLDQDLEKNKTDILKLANDAHLGYVQFIEEKISGKVTWRKRQIAAILQQAQDGDAIIVSELSRLGRSMLECMEILSLAMQKGIRIDAVKGNWQLNNSIQSKIVAMAFAMAAEIERDLISQRTTEALAARKLQGMPLGRPKGVGKSKLDAYEVEITALLKNGATKTWIARKYGTTRRNLSHWMKQPQIRSQPI
jgi:DNA invertase Pin-like site-specific DNA recombinase